MGRDPARLMPLLWLDEAFSLGKFVSVLLTVFALLRRGIDHSENCRRPILMSRDHICVDWMALVFVAFFHWYI